LILDGGAGSKGVGGKEAATLMAIGLIENGRKQEAWCCT